MCVGATNIFLNINIQIYINSHKQHPTQHLIFIAALHAPYDTDSTPSFTYTQHIITQQQEQYILRKS